MKKINTKKKSKGQSLVEYGLILALVSVVAITVLQTMGGQVKNTVSGLSSKLTEANWSSACTDSDGIWVATDAAALAAAIAVPRYAAGVAPCVCPTHPVTNGQGVYQDPGSIAALGGAAALVGDANGKCKYP